MKAFTALSINTIPIKSPKISQENLVTSLTRLFAFATAIAINKIAPHIPVHDINGRNGISKRSQIVKTVEVKIEMGPVTPTMRSG
jgi:hypothetical protein